MAAEVVLLLVLISVSLGKANDRLLDLKCIPANGEVGKATHISCSFPLYTSTDQEINIYLVSVYKKDKEDTVFTYYDNNITGDPRFSLPSVNNPSLKLSNTAVSDEGEYNYVVGTNRGIVQDRSFTISVTAKYNEPTTSSWPEQIKNDGHVHLYCNASGGYPAGAIHWFDNTNTNWTKNAILEITPGKDQLLQLSSKLSFTNIDPSWAPFRCVVLNNKFVQEGESTFLLKLTGEPGSSVTVTVVLVIVGIIAVLGLIGLLLRRKRIQQGRRPSTQPILRASAVHTTQDEDEDENEDQEEEKAEADDEAEE